MTNLRQWCIENEKYEVLQLYENAENAQKSYEIGFSSAKEVNWKCQNCGIQWLQSPNKMTRKNSKKVCPYCGHERPSAYYNLAISNPILVKQWNYERNSKLPTQYLPRSGQKVWWRCEKGHEWESIISDRVRSVEKNINRKRSTCPYCNHEKVSPEYNLVTEFPSIAKQWNYIKNASLNPFEIAPKSNKKVWWICEFDQNHIWQDKISNRTILNRKCPICSRENKSSFQERVLYYYLKKSFYDCEIGYRFFGKYEADIYIPSYNIVLEYDGWYRHSSDDSKEREKRKDKLLSQNGIEVIRIKEEKKENNEISYKNNIIRYTSNERNTSLNQLVQKVLSIMEKKTNRKLNKDVDFNRDYEKIENLYYHIRKQNSLAVKRPDLAKEWSNNNNISVDTISIGSNYKAKWICQKCSKEFEIRVTNRVRFNSGCPYCSGRKINEDDSLANVYPLLIAKEWNYEKNGYLLPEKISKGSNKKVWWKCENGHEWKTRVCSRTGKSKSKCPYCYTKHLTKGNTLEEKNQELSLLWNYEKNEGKTPKDYSYASNVKVWWKCKKGHEWQAKINNMRKIKSKEKCPYCTNRRLSNDNCLAVINKKLSNEWNYEKNKELKPENFLPSSKEKVWWKCKEGHEWQAQIITRQYGTGCPYCSGNKVSSKNSLYENRKDLLKEWNYKRNGDLLPKEVSVGSGKKVWWKCKEGHEWQDTVSHRSNGRGCPYCSGRRVTVENSLYTKRKDLLKEWNKEKNIDISPKEVSIGSGKKVWWKCEKGHEWQASICNRSKGKNCPICWLQRC